MDITDSRMTMYTINSVFLLFVAIRTTTGDLVQYPTDLNATFGQHVILPCQTNLELPVYWYFNKEEIFYGGKVSMSFQSMFSVLSEKDGEYNLSISSANSSYNGEYVCGDDEGQGERRSAYLYVTDAVAEKSVPSDDGTDNLKIVIAACVAALLVVVAVLITVGLVIIYRRRKRTTEEMKKSSYDKKIEEKHAESEAITKSGVDHDKLPAVVDEIRRINEVEEKKKQQLNKDLETSKRSSAESKQQKQQKPQANFPLRPTAKKKSSADNSYSLETGTQNEEEKPLLINLGQETESTEAHGHSEPKIYNEHSLTERNLEDVLQSNVESTDAQGESEPKIDNGHSLTERDLEEIPPSRPAHTIHRTPTQSEFEQKPSDKLVALTEAKSVADSGESDVDTTKQGQIANSSLTTDTQPESKLSLGSMVKSEKESLPVDVAETPKHEQRTPTVGPIKPAVPAKPTKAAYPTTTPTQSKTEMHLNETPTTPFSATNPKRVDDSKPGNSQMPSVGRSVTTDSTSVASPGNDFQPDYGLMNRK